MSADRARLLDMIDHKKTKIKTFIAVIKELRKELKILRPIPDAYNSIRAGTHMEFDQRRHLAELVGKYYDWLEAQEEKKKKG